MRGSLAAVLVGICVLVWAAGVMADGESPPEPAEAEQQFEIGLRYAHGREGTKKDPHEAVKWFRKAAEQGHRKAQVRLGMAYQQGRGVDKDVAESLKWLRKAAEQGHSKGMLELGIAYRDGKGVPRDRVRSLMWFVLSSQHGGFVARLLTSGVARGLKPRERKEAMKLVREWREAHGLAPVPASSAKPKPDESGAELEPASEAPSGEQAPEAPESQDAPAS